MTKMKPFERRWLTIREVAEILGIHRHSVWRFIERGEIPASRVGSRTLRVDALALEDYMKKKAIAK